MKEGKDVNMILTLLLHTKKDIITINEEGKDINITNERR